MPSELELKLKSVEAALLNDPQNHELLQLKTELEEVIQLESEVKNNEELKNLSEYTEYFGNANSEQEGCCANSILKWDNRSQSMSVGAMKSRKESDLTNAQPIIDPLRFKKDARIKSKLILNALALHLKEEEQTPSWAPVIEVNATNIYVCENEVKSLFTRRIPQWVQGFVLANYILENPDYADWPSFIIGSLRALYVREQSGKRGVISLLLIGGNGQQVRIKIPASPSDVGENSNQLSTYEFNITSSLASSILRNQGIKKQTKAKITFNTFKNTCCVTGTRDDIIFALKLIRIAFPLYTYPALTLEQDNLVPGISPDSSTSNYVSDIPKIIGYEFIVPRNEEKQMRPAFLMKVEKLTKALVEVRSDRRKQVCSIVGTQIDIDEALTTIKNKFKKKNFNWLEPNIMPICGASVFEFGISTNFVGKFAGKDQLFIKKIQRKTNALVRIRSRLNAPNEKTCSLKGTRDEVESAVRMIRDTFPQEKCPWIFMNRGCYTA